jgi:IMP dehydrogenase
MLPDKPVLSRAWDFKDLVIMPGGAVVPPDQVNLTTQIKKPLPLRLPLLAQANSAAECIALAHYGLVGLLSADLSFGEQIAAVRRIKRHQTNLLRDPVTITPDTSVAEAQDLQLSHSFSGLPVIDPATQCVCGIVTRADIAKAADSAVPVSAVMSTDLLTAREDTPDETVKQILQEQMVGQVLIIDDKGQLIGLRTASDFAKRDSNPFATRDKHGRLLAGAIVGTGAEEQDRITALLDMGADVLMVASDFAHSSLVQETITFIRRQRCEQHVTIIAGAVQTADGARALIDSGADMLFVDAHPVKSLVRVPGFTALQNVADAADLMHVPVWLQGELMDQESLLKALIGGAGGLIAGSVNTEILENWTQNLKTAIGQTGAKSLSDLPGCARLAIAG